MASDLIIATLEPANGLGPCDVGELAEVAINLSTPHRAILSQAHQVSSSKLPVAFGAVDLDFYLCVQLSDDVRLGLSYAFHCSGIMPHSQQQIDRRHGTRPSQGCTKELSLNTQK